MHIQLPFWFANFIGFGASDWVCWVRTAAPQNLIPHSAISAAESGSLEPSFLLTFRLPWFNHKALICSDLHKVPPPNTQVSNDCRLRFQGWEAVKFVVCEARGTSLGCWKNARRRQLSIGLINFPEDDLIKGIYLASLVFWFLIHDGTSCPDVSPCLYHSYLSKHRNKGFWPTWGLWNSKTWIK